MDKQELALVVIDRLKKEYPDAGCTLDYDDAWKLLVSVRLAAQCTDARVNEVAKCGNDTQTFYNCLRRGFRRGASCICISIKKKAISERYTIKTACWQ